MHPEKNNVKMESYNPAWLALPQVQKMCSLIESSAGQLAFVGGAVRDGLVGRTSYDFDVATSLTVAECMRLFLDAGHKAHILDPGLDVIILYIDGKHFDVMPLGNRVEGGGDPHLDFAEKVRRYVARFDFTINAVYVLPSGQLYDPFGGAEDIQNGVVRFINDPMDCVAHEPICILRFFRFHATLGKDVPDADAVAACAAHAALVGTLRGVRIRKEMLKLLAAPSCYETLSLMHAKGILNHAFGSVVIHCHFIRSLETIEGMINERPKAHLRLALLLLSADADPMDVLAHITQSWNIPDALYGQLHKLLKPLDYVKDASQESALPEQLAKALGRETYREMALLSWAMEKDVVAAKPLYHG